jgi:hypothetical protein
MKGQDLLPVSAVDVIPGRFNVVILSTVYIPLNIYKKCFNGHGIILWYDFIK